MAIKPGRSKRREPVPSFIQTMFEEGNSLWVKILGGALGTPMVVLMAINKARRRGDANMPSDLPTIALILLASCAVGAFLGAALSVKDAVRRRVLAGQSVPFPVKLLFGYGVWSILLWFPLVVGITLAIVVLTLGTSVL